MTAAIIHAESEKPRLHILMVEDMPEDFELVMHELDKSGLRLSSRRVETEEELVAELQRQPPDLVLSDHACGAFDSFGALARVRAFFLDVPFILVTGALGDGLMVKALDRGVDDWVSKHRRTDLLPAVLRALRLADERRRLRYLELERDRLRAEVAALRGRQGLSFIVPICSTCKKIRNEENKWISLEGYFDNRHAIRFSHGLCPECVKSCLASELLHQPAPGMTRPNQVRPWITGWP